MTPSNFLVLVPILGSQLVRHLFGLRVTWGFLAGFVVGGAFVVARLSLQRRERMRNAARMAGERLDGRVIR